MAASGIGAASGAGAYLRTSYNSEDNHAIVVGLPGIAYVQDGTYYDSQGGEVASAPADVELIRLRNLRTGTSRLVTLEALAVLLA